MQNSFISIVAALFVIATIEAAWFLNAQSKFVILFVLMLASLGAIYVGAR